MPLIVMFPHELSHARDSLYIPELDCLLRICKQLSRVPRRTLHLVVGICRLPHPPPLSVPYFFFTSLPVSTHFRFCFYIM